MMSSYLELDAQDALRPFREQFHIPLRPDGTPHIYLCGNSLGCQPKAARAYVEEELLAWERLGVEGHFHAPHPWMPYHEFLTENLAAVVGAQPAEVVAMGSLTANLHFLMVSFYRPTPQRYKILIEADAFPSDIYAVESQAKFHGYAPEDAILRLRPRAGEHTVHPDDVLSMLETAGDEIAMVLLGGVNYYTGQVFDMQAITALGHKKGCVVGFDLAHAVGNLALQLHDWDVDFAAWCSYKYLNGGPGTVGGIFVHQRHAKQPDLPRFTGWWGHDKATRFNMRHAFSPIEGAEGWQHSNAPVLNMAVLRASLDLFAAAGMATLRAKSERMTAYLEALLREKIAATGIDITLITPSDPTQRGCQLSLLTGANGKSMYERISHMGVIADWREPNVIRIAPAPLYNSFEDCYNFVAAL
jgi:kynureninase